MGLCVESVSRRQHSPPTAEGPEQPSALLIVILVHTDQQADALGPRCHPQGVVDEDHLEGLQQISVQVVAPEGLEVVQVRELDVADDRAQISGAKQHVGLTEQLELSLQGMLLV